MTVNSSLYFGIKELWEKDLCDIDMEALCVLQRHRKLRSQAFLEKVLSICFSFAQAQISRGPKHKQKKKEKKGVER